MLEWFNATGWRKKCMACDLRTFDYETLASAQAEWKVRMALEKKLRGDRLTPTEETILAYGYTAGACSQNLL
jgi:hypothetical protein